MWWGNLTIDDVMLHCHWLCPHWTPKWNDLWFWSCKSVFSSWKNETGPLFNEQQHQCNCETLYWCTNCASGGLHQSSGGNRWKLQLSYVCELGQIFPDAQKDWYLHPCHLKGKFVTPRLCYVYRLCRHLPPNTTLKHLNHNNSNLITIIYSFILKSG